MPNTLTHEPAALPEARAKGTGPSQPAAQWLVLEYLAAANDLEGELLSDLAEMERVGSTPGVVEILAQVDRSPGHDASKGDWHGTRRYYVTRGTVPADRGIAYDDSAADCLDNQELKRVVATAHRVLGRKVDVVGMDACLMTMIEVAYQLREHAQVLVGSEEVEPGPGWPHSTILADLTKNPAMTGRELGAAIVHRYVESYRHGGENTTQSAIDLGQLDDLVEAVDVLARRLLAGIKSAAVAASLLGARRHTLQFFEGFYVDLHHLAANLATATGNGRIADACRDVQRMIDGDEVRSPIIAQGHAGASMVPARGISIYFPLFLDRSAFYRELDFASATRWADFLEAFLSTGRARETR